MSWRGTDKAESVKWSGLTPQQPSQLLDEADAGQAYHSGDSNAEQYLPVVVYGGDVRSLFQRRRQLLSG